MNYDLSRNRWIRRMALLGGVLAAGCASVSSYMGVEPVYPGFGQVTGELQPTFMWVSEPNPDVRYDLIIYAPINTGALRDFQAERKSIYYRQGLAGNTHRVEIKLKPDMEYTWSIRKRTAEGVSTWTQLKSDANRPVVRTREVRLPRFVTPQQ